MSRSSTKQRTLFGAFAGLGTLVALVLGLGVFTGASTAASAAAPQNTAPPIVSGTAQEGQKLTGTKGEWSGTPTDYNYFWTRCDKNGASCSNISGATTATYTLTTTDIANTLRFKVRAKNASGVGFASSAPTAVVTSATKPPPPPPAGSTIPISKVSLPNRLILDDYSFSPSPLRSRQAVTARFHVSDSNGHSVSGAVVFLERVPVDASSRPPEQATGPDGWVSFSIYPNSGLQLSHQGQIVFFLRARKASENVLGGVSARRLVGIPLG